ncbi:MAG: 2-amino-4-hydroxy-6-hydroxymethyldihydropteridine diphosphokinase [Acidimicrobiales bacterium]
MTDAVVLAGLRVLGHHGADPGEQDRAQPFEIDLAVTADLSAAGGSDNLGDTIDYGALAAAAAAVVTGERHRLVERVAERITEVVLADPRVASVTVEVRKLRPPLPLDLASAGVRITRLRSARVRRVFLGLGSNLGDRRAHLRAAAAGLADVVAVSPVYESDPVGGPPGQGPYLNAVVELATALSPRELLEVARRLEHEAGRVPTARWGPRILDVDVLLVGDLVVDEPDLQVPHPRWRERAFVLVPLADLAPDLVSPPPDRSSTRPAGRVGDG